jgi:hypothetical protein
MRKLLSRDPYSYARNLEQIKRYIAETKSEQTTKRRRRNTTIVPAPKEEESPDENSVYQELVDAMSLVIASKSEPEPEKKTRRRTKKAS